MSNPSTQRGRIYLPGAFWLLLAISAILAVMALALADILGLLEVLP